MPAYREASPDQAAFMDELVEAGVVVPAIVPGVYGRSATFERVRRGFDALVERAAEADAPERLAFPPVLPRRHIESTGYLGSFPHLAGSVFAFEGPEGEARGMAEVAARHEDWSAQLERTELVLTPAACYPIYPAIAARGPLAPGGVTIDPGAAFCFRHEPSGDPARLQSFQMHELVRIGEPEVVQAWRDDWRDRAVALLRGVGLDADFDVAADPFFGRAGRLMAASQRQQELKFEVLVPITEPEATAVASFNYHETHFSGAHGIVLKDGTTAHTACLGFGLERITLALLRTHGLDLAAWPGDVREQLGL